MKRIRLFLRNLPRKTKIICNILLCLVLAFWIYLLMGSPADITTVYRRAERANLVGPGDILAVSEAPELGYEDLVLAESGNAVMLFVRDKEDASRTQLVYRERTQHMALLSVPLGGRNLVSFREIPIYLFDRNSNAQRAELTLSMPDGTGSSPVLFSRREADGFFRFTLEDKTGIHQQLLHRMLLLSENTMADTRNYTLLANIRLYDSKNTLLSETTLVLGE